MTVYFSEKFKQLRKANDLTQDQIAEIFHVSPQSVSRWETGANYPDIGLLPHIAGFFKVTVDELLGTELILGEEKAKEYRKEIRVLLNAGKWNEAIDTARRAVKEYPVNYKLQGLLMQALCVTEELR
jgi:transcriptional regulator with XRE-family HTH domain